MGQEPRRSSHRWSKKERRLWPERPTGDSSSLKVMQFSNIRITSAYQSVFPLYL